MSRWLLEIGILLLHLFVPVLIVHHAIYLLGSPFEKFVCDGKSELPLVLMQNGGGMVLAGVYAIFFRGFLIEEVAGKKCSSKVQFRDVHTVADICKEHAVRSGLESLA